MSAVSKKLMPCSSARVMNGRLAADLHAGDALVPSLDHHARAELELERIVAIARAVELLAVLVRFARIVQPPRVVHRDVLAGGGFGAGADLAVRDLQARDVVHL